MPDIVRQMLRSKKAVAALAGIVLVFLGKLGFNEESAPGVTSAVTQVTQVLMAYIVGQGLADMGKEKARFEHKSTNGNQQA